MKMKTKTIIATLLLCLTCGVAVAYDFSVTADGNTLCFNIKDKAERKAAVTYAGSVREGRKPSLKGKVTIPSKVRHNNVVYSITSIEPKAFAGETQLTEIVIPDGVDSIRDFAFEGCDSLKKVTFPANQVSFGEGVFFRCPRLADLNLGSDWTELNLAQFRWSEALDSIAIPAKIATIKDIALLRNLRKIEVSKDNGKFSSHDGMLYDKSDKTFLKCPRGYEGKVTVAEGTESIADGALIDCASVTALDLPGSLKSMSFRETSRMPALDSIVLRASEPILNAYAGEKGYFLLMLRNPSATVISVPAASLKAYRSALATAPGEYAATPEGLPYVVSSDALPLTKNFKKIKTNKQ